MISEKRIDKNPKCTIRAEWLLRIDELVIELRIMRKKIDSSILFCEICNMNRIHCATKGYQAIFQHVASAKHKQNADIKLNNTS